MFSLSNGLRPSPLDTVVKHSGMDNSETTLRLPPAQLSTCDEPVMIVRMSARTGHGWLKPVVRT
ncbi:hypothetical protein CPT_Shady_062 [Streptomyces phage Shady]|uniref:Uncharacterized protein n=1 Tax=Streptomyces phage Shady TaxID=2767585 RepID=A0A873WHJ0_9CAUD|nr:hypothetical protein CPT_Shady_062 [Streptomyces phage Shady]